MQGAGKEDFYDMRQKLNEGNKGKKWCIMAVVLCLSAVLLAGGRTKAASQSISLGTQGDSEISVKRGDEISFSLNTTDEASIYYSIREGIATVSYDVEEGVLTKKSDAVFQVAGVGSEYLVVTVKNQEGEIISERSYHIISSLDMSGVTLDKASLKGYQYDKSYGYQTFYINARGMEGIYQDDIDFSYTSSNKKMSVYCNFGNGQIVIETSDAGATNLKFTINGKVFKVKLTVSKVRLSCGSSLLLVQRNTKSVKVKGISGKIKWKSSNSKVLSVTKSGRIRAKKPGNALLTASVGKGKLGCAISVVTKTRKKVIDTANKMGKNWKYSQPKRMQKGYYDCSSLVWKSYRKEKKNFGMRNYAPVAADIGKWCAKHKKLVKGNAYKNIQKMKFRPGALTFKTGYKNGRYKGIYHVEMFTGYTFEGFDSNGKAILGTKWAARGDNYGYGELWAQP